MNRFVSRLLVAGGLAAYAIAIAGFAEDASASSLLFHGNGVGAPDLDRVKIEIDETGDSLPGPPADIGATDFTIEFWIKASAADNAASPVACGNNNSWINGNIVVDRDRYNQGRKYGISIAGGSLVFGVTTDSDRTVCGTADVLDEAWHHVAVTRDADTGDIAIWVDGVLDGATTGPAGDISYPDDGVPCASCCGGGDCDFSDPYIVLGAEKHDAGAAYPSYEGYLDELRLSNVVRYTAPFTPPASAFATDASTVALYHFDEGSADTIGDSSAHPSGPSDGVRHFGGSPAGPEWVTDTPFHDPSDLDGDGKPNASDECTVLVAGQGFRRTKLAIKGIGAGPGEQGLSWNGEFRPTLTQPVDPPANGVHLRIADAGATILETDIPGGLVGAHPSTPCDPRDGWTVSGSSSSPSYAYRNYSGYVDAACSTPTDVTQIKLSDQTAADTPRVRMKVTARDATLAVTAPLVSLESSLALSARPSPGVASDAAGNGGCGDFRWDPVATERPEPYCKLSPSPSAFTKLQCRTD